MTIRFGISGWSVWLVYLFVGMMQLTLIVMGVWFLIRERTDSKETDESAVADDLEGWHAYVRSRTPSTVSQARSEIAPDERSLLLPRRRASETR